MNSLGRLGTRAALSPITLRYASSARLSFEDRAFLAVRHVGGGAGVGLEPLISAPAALMTGAIVCIASIGHLTSSAPERHLVANQNIVANRP
jgi:hypothetical protein